MSPGTEGDRTDEGGDPACWSAHFDGEVEITNALLAGVVRRLADAVIICEPNGQIMFWNDAATRLFGWTADDALGESLDLIIPERFRARHWSGWNQTVETGTTSYGGRLLEVPALKRDGSPLSIAFTITLLTDRDQRRPKAIVAVVRDDTESWRRRRDLEAEVERLRGSIGSGVDG